jgi:hypothetical protein
MPWPEVSGSRNSPTPTAAMPNASSWTMADHCHKTNLRLTREDYRDMLAASM